MTKGKAISKMSNEEVNREYLKDCAYLLGSKIYEETKVKAMAAGDAEPNQKRKRSAFNMVFAKALRLEAGITSWMHWRKEQDGGDGKKAKPKKHIPPRAQKLNDEQMQDLIGTKKPKKEGRKTILGFIEGKY